MRLVLAMGTLVAMFSTVSLAQPRISALQNNYSWILPAMPNYGIAQGSIFDIFGTGLAASATALQAVPLQTTLNGVTVSVTVNGTTVHPILYFVAPTQIAAILPSATPVGTGQITVTSSGQSSAPAQIRVVQSAFGILTLNGAGNGPAAAFDVHSDFLNFTNAANPGDYITLWGSGVGSAPGDETKQQTPQDLINIPIEVDIGGVSAQVTYRGRSTYPGLDQINVVIPPGMQGCYVSVVVRSGDIVSNFATIPVAASGRTCSDETTGITTSQIQALASKSSFSIGYISLGKTTSVAFGSEQATDSAGASFGRYTPAVFNATTFEQTSSFGNCWVYSFSTGAATFPMQPAHLNAGPAIDIVGPSGRQTMTFQDGVYSKGSLGAFISDSGGTFNFENGSGGPDVGAFRVQLTLGSPLVWSNMGDIGGVIRSRGVTVMWSGGTSNSYVRIDGSSLVPNSSSTIGAHFTCTVPLAAQQFTVPPAVLLALPPTVVGSAGSLTYYLIGTLAVSNYSNPLSFTAQGLDLGLVSGYTMKSKLLYYQ